MSAEKTYFVSFVKPGGKRGLHPVLVDRLSGLDVQKGRDVEQALLLAKSSGLDVTGDVHTTEEISAAYESVSESGARTDDVVSNIYTTLVSRKGSDPDLGEIGEAKFSVGIDRNLEIISASINSFFYHVLPTNKAAIFIAMLGMTRPSFYKLLRGVGVLGEQVNFEGFVKVLSAMGILEEVTDLIKRRADKLEKSKESLLSKGVIEETQKSRKPNGSGKPK